MHTIAMEFENKKDLNEVVDKLWVARKVTGEMAIKPLSGGRWRLDLTSETDIKDKLLEKLPGKVLGVVEPTGQAATAAEAEVAEAADDADDEGGAAAEADE